MTGGGSQTTTHYVLKVEISGLKNDRALGGKTASRFLAWILNGDVPTFVKAEQALYWAAHLADRNRQPNLARSSTTAAEVLPATARFIANLFSQKPIIRVRRQSLQPITLKAVLNKVNLCVAIVSYDRRAFCGALVTAFAQSRTAQVGSIIRQGEQHLLPRSSAGRRDYRPRGARREDHHQPDHDAQPGAGSG